jgi:aminopeptidase C
MAHIRLLFRNVLELIDEPLDGRIMSYLNGAPIGDGGQWDMAYNLIGESDTGTGSVR